MMAGKGGKAMKGCLPGALASPRLHGALQSWDIQRACGFIECTELPGKKFFAHKTEFTEQFADGGEPPVGTPVTFVRGVDLKSGKERACGIQVQRRVAVAVSHVQQYGPGVSHVQYGPGRLYGTLTEWNSQKACGFIECAGAPGKKIFAHKSEFALQFADGDDPPIGTPLNFILGTDSRSGRQRAQDIQAGDGALGQAAPGGQQRLHGTLDEWNASKACGFINCLDIPGKKFFAHKSEFAEQFMDGSEPPPGTLVSFTPGVDARSGKERAQDIRIGTDSGAPPDSVGPQRLTGTLVDWKPDRACGFIECIDPAGKRYFAHKTEFEEPFPDGADPPVGTTMSFAPGVDQRSGRERARAIRVETGLGWQGPGVEGMPAAKRARTGWLGGP
mmetsp:Transcript_134851/g.418983  ORF Transcript_134851/g.418983 Transcript_134851/m.418983 type:complete len:388 (+) Transcript_134851:83-1246(+)|eukprot:CAMPEP_0204517806 /NCGR_PEP_ID=MMETSP0661-20131031/3865_1 /ASSEMBLY_ACC=CAM_ASM_000606 /TAXON_ID=109239 /ORGANISM="Alexandrium margalefi, Strain AMGDE01CS-322" /LENGTH=387 /DNA_ID=CAMNT_0051523219 /DNA_START=83 /DNA_END=1246 /DNA_ORIENTATION=+